MYDVFHCHDRLDDNDHNQSMGSSFEWKQFWASVEHLLTLKIMLIIMILAMMIYNYI